MSVRQCASMCISVHRVPSRVEGIVCRRHAPSRVEGIACRGRAMIGRGVQTPLGIIPCLVS